jgi:hypothetical protein
MGRDIPGRQVRRARAARGYAETREAAITDKRRARLNCISHILKTIPAGKVPRSKVKLPRRSNRGKYNDQSSLKQQNFVSERY